MNSVAVVGSREFNNYTLLKCVLDLVKPDAIVSGGAIGADLLTRRYAEERSIPIREFLPDYDRYSNSAPIIRNKEIVNASDKVIAFWDGSSKGTQFTIDYALNQKKPVTMVDVSKSFTRSDIIGEPVNRSDAWHRYLDSQRAVSGSAGNLKAAKSVASSIDNMDKRYEFSQKFVNSVLNIKKYLPLKDKDNVFLVMPSSSGNKFPFALATELQKSFGGKIITDFADQNHISGIKKLSGVQRVFSERSYSLKDDFVKSIDSLKGKNIVLVDDLISTGVTIDSLRAELSKVGLRSDYVCSLINTSASLCNENSLEKVANLVSRFKNEFAEYKEKTGVVFHNCLGGSVFHLLRGVSEKSDCNALRDYIDNKYSEYVNQLVGPVLPEKDKTKVFSNELKGYSVELPSSIIKSISSLSLNTKEIERLVESSVEKIKSLQYRWSDNNAGLEYCSDLTKSKYVLKPFEGKYAVFFVFGNESKFLGTDSSLDSGKNRIEQYCILNDIRSSLDLSISRKKDHQISLDL